MPLGCDGFIQINIYVIIIIINFTVIIIIIIIIISPAVIDCVCLIGDEDDCINFLNLN